MTIYEKELKAYIEKKFPFSTGAEIVDALFKIGVVDYSLCKVLAIRLWVDEQIKLGIGKVDALWLASEKFGCSYEYARKCIYYYKDVGL